ncbi:MAG TPA: glycogen/starch synthase, partial [Thermohalobaculum sp.]|nr:glycogen/starch synthase [Thermohalobaculum sp.]
MRVLFVASECAPLVKTGGLADVIGALAPALRPLDIGVRILLPGYPAVMAALDPRPEREPFGDGAALVTGTAAGLDLIVLDDPALYDRPGNPYLGPDGLDWPDNHRRFGALSRAAARVAARGASGWRPDLVHAHDWQAGMAPLMIRQAGAAVPCVLAVHNIAFQGLFPPQVIGELGLPPGEFRADGYEYWGRVGFLKAGLVNADWITTVSPTYARELAWPEYGRGLEGVIASRRDRLTGILNGIDEDVWDPVTDHHLAQPYGPRNLNSKRANRRKLIERYRLA